MPDLIRNVAEKFSFLFCHFGGISLSVLFKQLLSHFDDIL